MQRAVQILYYIMLAASAIIFLMFYLGPIVPGTEANPEPVITTLALRYAYVVLGLAAVLALVFPVIYSVSNPKNVGRSALVVLGILIIFGGCYYFSSGKVLDLPNYEGTDNVPWILRIVDTGLFAMYLAFLGAILSIVYAEVRRYFL